MSIIKISTVLISMALIGSLVGINLYSQPAEAQEGNAVFTLIMAVITDVVATISSIIFTLFVSPISVLISSVISLIIGIISIVISVVSFFIVTLPQGLIFLVYAICDSYPLEDVILNIVKILPILGFLIVWIKGFLNVSQDIFSFIPILGLPLRVWNFIKFILKPVPLL